MFETSKLPRMVKDRSCDPEAEDDQELLNEVQ